MKKLTLAILLGLTFSVNASAEEEVIKDRPEQNQVQTLEAVAPVQKNVPSESDVSFLRKLSVDQATYKLITDDNYLMLMQSRLAELEQKPFVESAINSILPLAINKYDGSSDKKFQLIEFFDFNCHYCRDAIEKVDVKLAEMKDVGLSYIVLLPEGSEETMVYASFGLTKVPLDKQKSYLLTMFELLNRNTVTLEQVKAELAKFEINPSEDEVKAFSKAQSELTNKVYLEMRLRGTPTFVMLPVVNSEEKPVEVILGTQAIPYLDLYKLKLSKS